MIYAQKDQSGQPIEVVPGTGDFLVYWLRIDSDEEAAWTALSGNPTPVGGDFLLPEPFPTNPSAFDAYGPEDWARRCIAVFNDPEPPAGKVLAGYAFALDGAGAITLTPVFEDVPIEEVRAAKHADAVARYEAERQSEFAWDFGAIEALDDLGASQGAAGLQTLQMREAPTPGGDDQKNWSILTTTALAYEAAGQGATLLPMKTTANVWVQTTASQVLDVLLRGDGTQVSAVQRGFGQLQRVGALKAQVAGAADAAAIATIDVAAGWPPANGSPLA